MAERYLYGPDKASASTASVDMKEATAMACEMVMMHGWSDLGPAARCCRTSRTEEKYLKPREAESAQSKVDAAAARWAS